MLNTTDINSILNSVKKMIGLAADYDEFDADIIMHINSVFAILHQMGVGPKDASYEITGSTETWTDFFTASGVTNKTLNSVKTYMFCKVKLLFDPPVSSSAMSSIEKFVNEVEWRLNVEHDDTYPT